MENRKLLISQPHLIHDRMTSNARIILHTGDSEKFLKTIPDNTIGLIVTSPPYNVGKEYEVKIAIEKYLSDQERIIRDLVRILKSDGSICWQVGNFVEDGEIFPLDIFYYSTFKRLGLKLRNRIVWHFGHGLHASKRFSGRYETLLWFTKSDHYTFNLDSVRIPAKYPGKRHYKGPRKGEFSGNPLGKNPSDIWKFLSEEWENNFWDIPNVKSNHPEKTVHPCQFPIELVERCVLAFTRADDWVLDPFCGVGSALIAGIKQDRRVIGIDKEEKYTRVARQRINDFFDGNLAIRPLGTPVYEPDGRSQIAKTPLEWLGERLAL